MKTMRSLILCLVALLLSAPFVRAQDLSKYRNFSLGMNVTTLLERTSQKVADANVIHQEPALLQEVTWWPPNVSGTSFQPDPVEQILFSFYNGALYKISVTYDRASTAGLTAEDMVKSISAKYGPATTITPEVDAATTNRYEVKQKPVASWEDSQYSFELVRSSFTDGFGLVIYSKRVNAEAELATTQALKLEEQQGPKREAERQKKDAEDLEVTRQKNQKSFQP
jgi:hypothetical protein